ncbi:MAG: S8 family serine peptidase [Fibrobacterota bacterium]
MHPLLPLLALVSLLNALSPVQQETGLSFYHDRGLKGAGVICAVVDDVDITLNDFRDPVTHQTRILAYKRYYEDTLGNGHWDLWSKTRIDSLLNASYPYAQFNAFDSNSIFHNRKNDHGTIIAGIMAGNGTTLQPDGIAMTNLLGMAPESKIVIVSRPFDSSIIFIDSVARANNMPWSANISWTTGPESEIRSITGAGKHGKAVTVASGNNNYQNYRKVIFAPGDSLFTMNFALDTPANFAVGKIGPTTYYFYVTSYNLVYSGASTLRSRFRTQYNETVTFNYADSMPGDSLFYRRGNETAIVFERFLTKRDTLHQRVEFMAQTDRSTTWKVDLVKAASALAETVEVAFSWQVDNYAPYGLLPSIPFDTARTTLVDFAMMEEVTTVGISYHYNIPGTGDTAYLPGMLCPYSGRGPTWDNRIKPDLVAPDHGMPTLSVINTAAMTNLIFHGTSFAAPMVAGAVALMLQEDSTRDAIQIKQILKNRARSGAYTGSLPNSSWGWGILQLDTAQTSLVSAPPALTERLSLECAPNPFNPSLSIRIRGLSQNTGAPARLAVFDIRGRCITNLTDHIRDNGVEWNASGRAAGVYLVRLTTGPHTVTRAVFLGR